MRVTWHVIYDGIRNGTTRSSLCSTLISFNATYDFCVKFRIWNGTERKSSMKCSAKTWATMDVVGFVYLCTIWRSASVIGAADSNRSASAVGISFSKPTHTHTHEKQTTSKQLKQLLGAAEPNYKMYAPFATLTESSCSVPHCCDSLCEYNRIRSFNSCGSKLCESMAATSIIFLCRTNSKHDYRRFHRIACIW